MMRILAHIFVIAAALLVMDRVVPGIAVSDFYVALLVACIWGLVTLTVRPVLSILTLPITLITFGLFSFVLNALLFWLVSSIVAGFVVAGFVPALIGSTILAVVSWMLDRIF